MTAFQRSYDMEPNPPPPMQWDTYEQLVMSAWQQLLASDPEEPLIQEFLEQHPCLLPGALGLGFTSGHYPLFMGAVTQPTLQGLRTRVPDFMWLASDSSYVYPVLIEIEAPRKPWFTKGEQPHNLLTAAINQLSDWRAWFSVETNVLWFLEYYDIGYPYRSGKALKPLFVLVYGKRSEFDGQLHLSAKKAQLARENETLMTYDRLAPSRDGAELMCLKRLTSGGYEAVSIPPTLRLSPISARDRLPVHGKVEAAQRNSLISPERKAFLSRRFPYWDEWVKRDGRGAMGNDRE